MSIRGRVIALERVNHGTNRACPTCGRLSDGSFLTLPTMCIRDNGAIELDALTTPCPTCGLPPFVLDFTPLLGAAEMRAAHAALRRLGDVR